MAVESIGGVYNVKIPGLTDAADIQAAFQAYHYGAYTSTATTACKCNRIIFAKNSRIHF